MRGTTPTIPCDGDEGFCGAWDVDNYEASVTSINGVRVTSDRKEDA